MKLKKYFITALSTLMLAISLTQSAYAVPSGYETDYSDSVDWRKFSDQNVTLNVYNWGEYISVDDGEPGAFDVNAEFEKLTGIKVNYTNFASNEELYAKLRSGGAPYDIIIPSDYMIARLINEKLLEKLNFDNIPNFSYIDQNYVNPDYDPKNEYSVPYMCGTVGIIYNKTLVDSADEVDSWHILWNEKYAGNILMFSNSRDAFAIALFKLGYSINTTNPDELRAAADELKRQKPIVQAYVMDEIFDKMGGGEAALAPYYAGDALVMISDNPDLAFCVPREGTNLFADAVCIPKGAKNKDAAEMYINFLCETLTALKNTEYIGYSTPHTGAFDMLDDELKTSVIAYPTDDILKNAQTFIALPEDTTKLVDSLWTEILSSVGTNPWMTPVILVSAVGLTIYINVRRMYKKRVKNFDGN